MNKKQEAEEVLVDSIKKSFLSSFKEILGVDKIPKSIWEDSFLGGFLLSYFGEYLSHLKLVASMDGESLDIESGDFERIITKIDPNNKKLIMDFISGEIEPDYKENEYQRGEDLAKKVLYLSYKENVMTSLPFYFDDEDEDIIFAYEKANTIYEILSNAYPDSPVIEGMTRNQAASQALTYYKVFEYVKENKDKFINLQTGIDDDPLTLRDMYKYSKSNLGKGLKSGFNNVLDADLKKVGNQTEKIDKEFGKKTGTMISDLFIIFIKLAVIVSIFIAIMAAIIHFL